MNSRDSGEKKSKTGKEENNFYENKKKRDSTCKKLRENGRNENNARERNDNDNTKRKNANCDFGENAFYGYESCWVSDRRNFIRSNVAGFNKLWKEEKQKKNEMQKMMAELKTCQRKIDDMSKNLT